MNRSAAVLPVRSSSLVFRHAPAIVVATVIFLLTIRFGGPPSATLDAAWTEVLAWASLKELQFGSDLVFSYGPLGFLHPYSGYFQGIFNRFVAGQVAMALAFSIVAAALLRGQGVVMAALFALAYACSCIWIPGDVAFGMLIVFGAIIVTSRERPAATDLVLVTAFAIASAAIALIKFSLCPLALLGAGAVSLQQFVRHGAWRGISAAAIFVLALVVVWLACGQALAGLPQYATTSLDLVAGYGRAMGLSARPVVELAGMACIAMFTALCLVAAWYRRRDPVSLAAIALCAAAALLIWRSNFTRGDHAPWFFANLAMLPFALLCLPALAGYRLLRAGLVVLLVASAMAGLHGPGVLQARGPVLLNAFRDNLHRLTHLAALRVERDAQWAAAAHDAELPRVRQRVGAHTIDVFSAGQGYVLLNGFNYSPRPVFQSYSAFTPALARLNEQQLLGEHAPDFVLLQPLAIDGRFPLIEDSLSYIALLRRYRPVLTERGFLLLQRDADADMPAPAPVAWTPSQLGSEVAVDGPAAGSLVVARVRIEPSFLGRLYALALREPVLRIAIRTDSGSYDYRFLRDNGAAGFVLSPVIRGTYDWARTQLGALPPSARSFRVDVEAPWQRIFFKSDIEVSLTDVAYLRGGADGALQDAGALYPGFNLMPSLEQGLADLVTEEGHSATFLHAPAVLRFTPASGRYRISANFGVRVDALKSPACAAADGIGVGFVHIHEGVETALLHLELDPFHSPADRGTHRIEIESATVQAGDSIEYRVDPGHGGTNTACDWSYVRDLQFSRFDNAETH
jgi:hypothetical protein